MYCPKCHHQFRDGFIFCERCNESLIDTMPPEPADNPIHLEKYLEAGETLTCIGNKTTAGIISSISGVLVFGSLSILMIYFLHNDLQIKLWMVLLFICSGVLLIYHIFSTIFAFQTFYHHKTYLTDKNVIFIENQEFFKISLDRIRTIVTDNVKGRYSLIRHRDVKVKLFNGEEYRMDYITEESAREFEEEFQKWANQKRRSKSSNPDGGFHQNQ